MEQAFPWADALKTGGLSTLVIVLLYMLGDAYKQIAKQNAVISDFAKAVDISFVEVKHAVSDTCKELGGELDELGTRMISHDDRVKELVQIVRDNQDRIDINRTVVEKILDKLGEGKIKWTG